jgi:hypothetical protein
MAIENCIVKEIRNLVPETEESAINAAITATEGLEGFETVPVLTQHVLAIIECLDTVTDEFRAACVGADKAGIDAGVDACGLSDAAKEYLKGRVALDFDPS